MHNKSNRDVICEQRPGLLHLQACLIQCVRVVDIHFLLYSSLSWLSFADAPQLFWDMDLMCTCLNRHYLPLQQIFKLVRSTNASTSVSVNKNRYPKCPLSLNCLRLMLCFKLENVLSSSFKHTYLQLRVNLFCFIGFNWDSTWDCAIIVYFNGKNKCTNSCGHIFIGLTEKNHVLLLTILSFIVKLTRDDSSPSKPKGEQLFLRWLTATLVTCWRNLKWMRPL